MTFKLTNTVHGFNGTHWIFQHDKSQFRVWFSYDTRQFEAEYCPRGENRWQPRPKLLDRMMARLSERDLAEAMTEAIRWSRK